MVDLEDAHCELVRRIHAVRKIPKMIEADCSQDRETVLDPVSSEEEFYLSHLNKSFDQLLVVPASAEDKGKTQKV